MLKFLFIYVYKIVRFKDVGFLLKLNYFFYRKLDFNNDFGNDVGLVIVVFFGIMFIFFVMVFFIFFFRRCLSKIFLFVLLEK